MIEIKGKYNEAKIFTDVVDSASIAQVQELCNQEFTSGSRIRLMPDIHAGAGCTIGIIVGICMYAFLLFNMVSGGSTNLLERYYNQYMQEYQMTPDNGTTTDGNTI